MSKPPPVTRGGRAVSEGWQTRASLSVRRRHRHQDRPLPFTHQCYPPAMAPRPLHPSCLTDRSAVGIQYSITRSYATPYTLMLGYGLLAPGVAEWEVEIFGLVRGSTYYSQFALGYVRAALHMGLKARLLRRTDCE